MTVGWIGDRSDGRGRLVERRVLQVRSQSPVASHREPHDGLVVDIQVEETSTQTGQFLVDVGVHVEMFTQRLFGAVQVEPSRIPSFPVTS